MSDEETKKCSKCLEIKPRTEFYPNRSNGKVYLRADCKSCQKVKTKAFYMANQDRQREYMRQYGITNAAALTNARLVRTYNITLTEYTEMVERQEGRCAICTVRPTKALSVDHDHTCCPGKRSCGKCVRRLLCASCNTALGLLRDDPALLRAAANYIEQHVSLW